MSKWIQSFPVLHPHPSFCTAECIMSIVADKYKIYAGDIGINKKSELKKGTQGKRQNIYSDGLFNFILKSVCLLDCV